MKKYSKIKEKWKGYYKIPYYILAYIPYGTW